MHTDADLKKLWLLKKNEIVENKPRSLEVSHLHLQTKDSQFESAH